MTKSIYDQLVTSNTNSLVYNVSTGGSQFNGMGSDAPSGGVRARVGVKILASFAGIGSQIQNVTIGIRKNGTVSGLVNVQYINSSYTVLATASMNASDLGNGDTDTYNFKLSSQVTIASGDRLLIQYSGTAWSNGVILNGASGTRPTNTTYTYEGTLNSNSFTDGSGGGVPMMTFDSVLSGVTRQRFVETFSGDALDTDRWTYNLFNGTGAGAMSDEVDGGFKMSSTATGATSECMIAFDDKRQYSHTGSTWIAVVKSTNTIALNHSASLAGLKADDDNTFNGGNLVGFKKETNNNDFISYHSTNVGGQHGSATTGVGQDQNYHTWKGELSSSDYKLTEAGILRTSETTNLPVSKLQPFVYHYGYQPSAGSGNTHCAYMEAYNT